MLFLGLTHSHSNPCFSPPAQGVICMVESTSANSLWAWIPSSLPFEDGLWALSSFLEFWKSQIFVQWALHQRRPPSPAFYRWWLLQGRILQIYLATCLTLETDFSALGGQGGSQIPLTLTESLLHDCPRLLTPSVSISCYSHKLAMTRAGSRALDKIQINFEVRDYLNWIWGGPFLSAAGVVFSHAYKSILLKCQSYRSRGRAKGRFNQSGDIFHAISK